MADFVIEQNKDGLSHTRYSYQKCFDYATFLKQPLQLDFFVPTDKNGNILKGKPLSPAPDSEWIRWENEKFEFYEALERVLFKGFGVMEQSAVSNCVWIKDTDTKFHIDIKYGTTVEQLVKSKLELTETAIKQIGL